MSREALAGQMSMMPGSSRCSRPIAIEFETKFASSDMSGAISTSRNSSPPQV
jgi:hypothetical protein